MRVLRRVFAGLRIGQKQDAIALEILKWRVIRVDEFEIVMIKCTRPQQASSEVRNPLNLFGGKLGLRISRHRIDDPRVSRKVGRGK